MVCEQGYRYGSPCYFSCDDDFALEGTANVTCEKMGNPPYGAWTFGIRQPKCTGDKLQTKPSGNNNNNNDNDNDNDNNNNFLNNQIKRIR